MRQPKFPAVLPADALDRRGTARPAPDAADVPDPIAFSAVPRVRRRRHGWTEERQRAFIAALARCGSVSAAAKEVGLTARSAYRLLDAPGAEGFARAWDVAVDEGLARLRANALERALHGGFVGVYRRGKLVRVEHRHSDRLAIALLSGRPSEVEAYRRTALSRCEHRRDLAELDAARATRDQRVAEAEQAFRAEADRLVDAIHTPRVRFL